MAGLSVVELWGVAARLTKRLNALGIHSVLDLARADPVRIRDRFSVVMMRTVLELQGTPCIPMEEERIGRDQLIFSRSFATPITTAAGIRQVMSVYGQQASARLAKHGAVRHHAARGVLHGDVRWHGVAGDGGVLGPGAGQVA